MKKAKDFILIITWPYGLVNAANSWYDFFLSDKGNYEFGHTALILVNSKDGTNHYFDYGRFENFNDLGRIRNSISDEKLEIKSRAVIINGDIINKDEIFQEINNNPSAKSLFLNSSHQKMYCSIINNINFKESYQFAISMMKNKYEYGPFIYNGLTCGRFVYRIVNKSNASFLDKLKTILFDVIIRLRIFEKLATKIFFKNTY